MLKPLKLMLRFCYIVDLQPMKIEITAKNIQNLKKVSIIYKQT